jgi:hypothetical protein
LTFSRPLPLQIGGESVGERRTVELVMSPRDVRAVDWRRLDGDDLPAGERPDARGFGEHAP